MTIKTRFVEQSVPKLVGLDRLQLPISRIFSRRSHTYHFLPSAKGTEVFPAEVRYGYKFYILADPSKEGVFYLSFHR